MSNTTNALTVTELLDRLDELDLYHVELGMSVYTEWLDKLDELFELIQSKSLKICFMNHLSVFNNNLEVKTAKELIDVFAKSYTDTFKHFHSIHDQELNGALSIYTENGWRVGGIPFVISAEVCETSRHCFDYAVFAPSKDMADEVVDQLIESDTMLDDDTLYGILRFCNKEDSLSMIKASIRHYQTQPENTIPF